MEKREIPKRKQIRLKEYDYSGSGYYFVTICTQNRECIFGNIVGVGRDRPEMVLNKLGKIAQSVWQSLPKHHPVELDRFQIMPNHVHMIIIIVGARFSRPIAESKPTLGNIVAYFKYQSTKQINEYINGLENSNIKGREDPAPTYQKYKKIFQRNYYEHVIRNESELNKIQEYIKTNPNMWDRDRNNPEFKN